MGSPGEGRIAGIFRSRLGCAGAPDDADALGARCTHACIDTLSWGPDVPPGMTPRMAGRKAAVACVSDFAAKGVRPVAGVVSVTAPQGTTARVAAAVASGLAGAAREYGFGFVGGDTGGGAELSLSVCLFGAARRAVGRGGARPGDLVFVTGPFGYAAAGLELSLHGGRASPRFAARALRAVRRPAARLAFGLAAARHMTASMDSSDGLSTTLHGIAAGSGARIVVDRLPAGPGVEGFAAANGLDPARLVLDGGEEYEVAFAAPPAARRRVAALAARLRVPLAEVGRVVEGRGVGLGPAAGGGEVRDGGWRHLAGPRRGRRAPARGARKMA